MSARDRQRAADFLQLVRDDAALEALREPPTLWFPRPRSEWHRVPPIDAAQYEAFAARVGPAPQCVLAQADPDEVGDYDPPWGDPER